MTVSCVGAFQAMITKVLYGKGRKMTTLKLLFQSRRPGGHDQLMGLIIKQPGI